MSRVQSLSGLSHSLIKVHLWYRQTNRFLFSVYLLRFLGLQVLATATFNVY